MPRVNLSRYTKNPAPPIDWLWAAILERQSVYGYDLKKMAEVAGVSYDYMRRIIRMPTSSWPYKALKNICGEFGIKLTPVVGNSFPME